MPAALAFGSHVIQQPHGPVHGASCTRCMEGGQKMLFAVAMTIVFLMGTTVLRMLIWGRVHEVNLIRQLAVKPTNISTNASELRQYMGNWPLMPGNFKSIRSSIQNMSGIASESIDVSGKNYNPEIRTMLFCNSAGVKMRMGFSPLYPSKLQKVVSPWVSYNRCYRFPEATLWSEDATLWCNYERWGDHIIRSCPLPNLRYSPNAARRVYYETAPQATRGPIFI